MKHCKPMTAPKRAQNFIEELFCTLWGVLDEILNFIGIDLDNEKCAD